MRKARTGGLAGEGKRKSDQRDRRDTCAAMGGIGGREGEPLIIDRPPASLLPP